MTALLMTLFLLIQPASFNERFGVWTKAPFCHEFGARPTNCREFI